MPSDAGSGVPAFHRRIAGSNLWLSGWIVLILAGLWAFGALWFDFPVHGLREAVAWIFVTGAIASLAFVRPRWRAKLGVATAIVLIAACWLTLKPSNDRNWQPDVARTALAEIQGDSVTFHNVRNFDYHTETDYTPRWETRTVQLSKITGLYLAINYWGSPWMAHPIACFAFSNGLPLSFLPSKPARRLVKAIRPSADSTGITNSSISSLTNATPCACEPIIARARMSFSITPRIRSHRFGQCSSNT